MPYFGIACFTLPLSLILLRDRPVRLIAAAVVVLLLVVPLLVFSRGSSTSQTFRPSIVEREAAAVQVLPGECYCTRFKRLVSNRCGRGG